MQEISGEQKMTERQRKAHLHRIKVERKRLQDSLEFTPRGDEYDAIICQRRRLANKREILHKAAKK